LGRFVIAAFAAAFVLYVNKHIQKCFPTNYTVITPITLKVRLNT
jgi:hypothetical protein